MHVWGNDLKRYPFPHPYDKEFKDAPYKGTLEMLIEDMDRYGCTHAVLVQVIFHGWDNTYIADCVAAMVAAATRAIPGETFNLGGGETATVWDILGRIEKIAGRKFAINKASAREGDQRYTFADTSKLKAHLGWEPRVTLDEGLARQWAWQEKTA